MHFKNKREQGYYFENLASQILISSNYKIVKKNFYSKFGEIDLIGKKNDLIIFVEIKQRTSSNFGFGEDSITFFKKKRLFLSAKQFLYEKNLLDFNIRFDAIVFYGKDEYSYKWIKNIIWGDELGF